MPENTFLWNDSPEHINFMLDLRNEFTKEKRYWEQDAPKPLSYYDFFRLDHVSKNLAVIDEWIDLVVPDWTTLYNDNTLK